MKRKLTRILGLLLAAAFAVAMLAGFNSLTFDSGERSLQSAETAVRRSAALCYALEGSYPQEIQYLSENYGLYLNTDKYVYHYRFLGGNLLPEIAVFKVSANDKA